MKKLIFPLILALIGVGGGIGAGLALRPEPEPVTEINPCGDPHAPTDAHSGDGAMHASAAPGAGDVNHDDAEGQETASHEYIKLNNQFIIPVVSHDMVDSLVVISLSIEALTGQTETIYAREPKLRDAFLQVLFDHANIGGFDGAFTDANNLDVLRMALTETAQNITGDIVNSVLITDIARQDL